MRKCYLAFGLFCFAIAKRETWPSHCSGLYLLHRHAQPVGLLCTSDQPVSTQQTQLTNVHALSGIRTRGPSIEAVADLRLRPHFHRDRLSFWFNGEI